MRLFGIGVGPWDLEITLHGPGAVPLEEEQSGERLGAETAFGFAPDPAFRDPYPYEDKRRRRR